VDSVEVLELLNDHPELLSHIVTEIDVEITNECNLRCIFCPRRIMKREKGYMTLDLFKKIIDELQGASVSISFTLYGEPLLHPLFLEMVRYAKDRRHSVYLYTNGTLLDEAKSRELIQIGLDGIIVSLDAARRDTYARIKESQGFEDVVKNIEGFLRVKREVRSINPRVGLQILKIKETNAEIKEFMDRWNWMGRVKKMIDYKKRVEQGSAKANKELWETFYLKAELPVEHVIVGHFNRYCDQIADRGVSDFTPRKRFLCRQLLEGVSVLWNGDVTLCRQDFDGKMVVGNLNDTPLKEILNNSYRIETIKAQSREDYTKGGLCSTCKEWYYSRG
jgi:spiro-SPASM protein